MDMEIKAQSKCHLTTWRPSQARKREDAGAVDENWEQTFGKDCDKCGKRHSRHKPCEGD